MSYRDTLLAPLQIGPLTSENRFFAQSMECTDADEHGNPSDITLRRYENLYKGRFGLIDLEAITITNESRGREAQLSILPENEKALGRFIRGLREINPKALIVFQLTHSGELSNPNFSRRVTIKPTHGLGGEPIGEAEIDEIMDEFAQAAKICQNVGADGVDMKLCHGYLGSQILRPFNDRNWKYGGSWANRSRFAYDLMERIQKATHDDKRFLIGSKVSMWEGYPGGCGSAGPDSPLMDLTESIDLLVGLEARGAQYFVQSLGNVHASMDLMEATRENPYLSYLHFYFAHLMKQHLKPETVVIGSHFSSFRGGKNKLLSIEPEKSSMFAMGARCIEDGMMDMIGLGRQSLADPLTPAKLMDGQEDSIRYCTQCMHCEELMLRQKPVGCPTFNRYYTDIFVQTRKEMGELKELHT